MTGRRPPLTTKVIRGLDHVVNHAYADWEHMSGDETRAKDDLDDMEVAIDYLRKLLRWYRASQP